MILYDGSGNEVSTGGKNVLKGSKVVILADSIFDYEVPDTLNIGDYLTINYDCEVHNWAQGGCCMALGKATNYDPYSFAGLSLALTTRDFTDQIANAAERSFEEQVEDMQSFSMATCDFLIVGYGTNDFWRAAPVENDEDDDDPEYFKGAIKYGVNKLLTSNPSLKILFLNLQQMNPTYIDSGGIGWVYPEPYNTGINEMCESLSVPVLDIWGTALINDYTAESFYHSGRPHLSRNGKLRYATMIANALDFYY